MKTSHKIVPSAISAVHVPYEPCTYVFLILQYIDNLINATDRARCERVRYPGPYINYPGGRCPTCSLEVRIKCLINKTSPAVTRVPWNGGPRPKRPARGRKRCVGREAVLRAARQNDLVAKRPSK